ncbi:MAG: hypothetical protein R2851_13435 [Caldilineaceae bacterium]
MAIWTSSNATRRLPPSCSSLCGTWDWRARPRQRQRRGDCAGSSAGGDGAVLLATALDELERSDGETALVTLCAGGGMGIATIIERV